MDVQDDIIYQGIIHEADYEAAMERTVLPYLNARRRTAWVPCWEGPDSERKLHVQQYLADRPRGVVVISHGFTEYAEKYAETIYYFLKEHYHVYIPEHCGHGKSYRLASDPSLVHIDHWYRYPKDFLRISVLIRKAHPGLPLYLYGHSMGGAIAGIAAAWSPGMYRKVILSAPMIRPLTGNVPYPAAVRIARAACHTGNSRKYVPGQRPYTGRGKFENSSGLSLPRFERYQKLRAENRAYQTNGASYGWLYNAAKMNWYLQRRAWREIEAPVLLFQAETDSLVSLRAQDIFAEKINRYGKTTCRLVRVPGSRHEICNNCDEIVGRYWGEVFEFLRGGR